MDGKKSLLKAKLALLILIHIGASSCYGQISWNTTGVTTKNERYSAIFPTSDGNILLAGENLSDSTGGREILLKKMTLNGDLLWRRTFTGINPDFSQTILSTTDGNYLLVQKTLPGIWLLKINPEGETLWTKTYECAYDPESLIIFPTTNGTILIGGSIELEHAIMLMKINEKGDSLWSRNYGGKDHNNLASIISTTDGNFLMVGVIGPGDEEKLRGFIRKFNPQGDTLWTRTFATPSDNFLNTILPTTDGNFIVGGITQTGSIINNDVAYIPWLIKINLNGDTLWTKTFPGFNTGNSNLPSFIPTIDGNFLLQGNDRGNHLIWLMSVGSNGELLWHKNISGINDGEFANMVSTSEGNYLLGYSIASKSRDVLLLKIKPTGDTLWTARFGGKDDDYLESILPLPNGNFLLSGFTYAPLAVNVNHWLQYLIGDKYVYKGSIFSYKIPVHLPDSLDFIYNPISIPFGMTVSSGGTISWTPQTDSAWIQQVKYEVMNDAGQKDTLAFTMYVNYHGSTPAQPHYMIHSRSKPFSISTTSSSQKIKFTIPASVSSICIYDISGKLVDRINPVPSDFGAFTIWPAGNGSGVNKIPPGKYFAKVTAGPYSTIRAFFMVK